MTARSTPIPAVSGAPAAGETSEVRVLAARAAPEPPDAALAWLDAQLADDMLVDESAIDLLAIADDESARPIPEDEMTPPRPSKIPSELPRAPATLSPPRSSKTTSAPPPSR